MKRLLSLVLSLALILSLAACGGDPDQTGPGQNTQNTNPGPGQTSGEQTGPIVTGVSFPEGLESIEAPCVVGGELYAVIRKNLSSGPQLLCLSLDDGSVRDLPDFKDAGDGQDGMWSYILDGAIQPGPEGTLWLSQAYHIQTQTGEGDITSYHNEEIHILRQLDKNGGELSRLTVNDEEIEEAVGLGYFRRFLVDGDGDVFAVFQDGVAALDEAGAVRFTLKPKVLMSVGGDGYAVVLGDGRLAMGCMGKDNKGNQYPVLRPVDKDAQDWAQDQYQLDTIQFHNIVGLFSGDDNALFYYRNGDSIRAWRAGAEESKEVVSLTAQGVGTDILAHVSLLADGRLVLVTGDGYTPELTKIHLVDLERAAAGDGRTVLTYATLQLAGGIDNLIAAFNKTDPDYRIELVDYSQYGDVDAARTRLITEISAGKMPDLLDTWAIPLEKWAKRGYLEDLWPWIEDDPDLGREALMEKVFLASEIDRKLYEVSDEFCIQTVTGAKRIVGDRMTWTWEDMWAALEAMPEGCVPMKRTQSGMLSAMMRVDPTRFLDQTAGTCSFDSDEFRSVLELCASYPDDALNIPGAYSSLIYEGQIMLLSYPISKFYFPQEAKYLLHEDISYVGEPNPWGEVGSQFSFAGSSVAMSSVCIHKEGAWRFLRTILLPHEAEELDAAQYSGFPTNKADFQALAEAAMEVEYIRDMEGNFVLDGGGNKVQEPHEGGIGDLLNDVSREEFQFHAMTQEEYDQIMGLYDAVEVFSRWDPDLEPIITSAAAPYFAGAATLDDTARTIQDRVTLYLGEQG